MRNSLSAFVFVTLAATTAFGQITGELRGTVVDSTGAAVPGANVSVQSRQTGESRVYATDGAGLFAAPLLAVGEYDVRVEAAGFRAATGRAQVSSGSVSSVKLALELGQVTENVTVAAAMSNLDTEGAQIQNQVVGEKLQEIPVNRNPNLFALTVPGMAPVSANNPFLGSGSFNANGGRGRGNNVTVDGITATDVTVTGTGGTLGPLNFSELAEAKIITNNFSAEHGRNSSAQVLYITKGGTNQLHGELYEYLQNDKLNARPFFDRTGKTNIVRQNTYGFSVGGPVFLPGLADLRNKLFWRTSYEGLKTRGAGAARTANVPTADMLAQVTDPTSRGLLEQYKIPAATASGPGFGTVQQNAPNTTDSYQFSARSDYNISDRDRLWARYARNRATQRSAGITFINTNLANFGASSIVVPQQATLSHTHTFGAAAVNEFRFGFGQNNPVYAIDSNVPVGPRILFQDGLISNFGQVEIFPQGRDQRTFQFTNNYSFTAGRHFVKMGFEHFQLAADSVLDSQVRPVFTFANWAGFASGTPALYSQNFGNSAREHRQNMQYAFFQDDWKVSRNLTLNLGVRFETNGGVTETKNQISNLNLGCRESYGAAGSGPLGCLQVVPRSFARTNNWAPRFGFAYNVGGRNTTVISGGYGMAYDFIFFNPITNQRFLPPFIVNGAITGASNFTGENSFARIVAGTSRLQQQTAAQTGKLSDSVLNYGNVNPALNSTLRNPQVHQWNLSLQREFAGLVWKARYVGTKGNYLPRTRAINPLAAPPAPATSVADETARLAEFQAANAGLAGNAARRSNRLDGRYNQVNYVEDSANSNYHAAQFEVQRRLSADLLFNAAYTVGKSIDDNSDVIGVLINDSANQQDPLNNRDNRAVSQFDLPQRLVLMHTWRMPFFKNASNGLVRQALYGWSFAGITSFRSGFPVSLESGARRGIAASTMTGIVNGPVRPNVTGAFGFSPVPAGSAGAPSAATTGLAQNISAYASSLGLSQPLLGNYGSLGRNTHRLNGETNFDWNLYKDFFVSRERDVKIQFRAEMYNVFNNTSFQDVNRNITSAAFGQYTTVAQNARFIQLALRLVF